MKRFIRKWRRPLLIFLLISAINLVLAANLEMWKVLLVDLLIVVLMALEYRDGMDTGGRIVKEVWNIPHDND